MSPVKLAFAMAIPALLAVATRPAYADPVIEASCLEQLNLPEGGCACIAEMADTEMDDTERAFVRAMLQDDQATTARLRAEMPIASSIKAGMFMTTAPQRCADPAR